MAVRAGTSSRGGWFVSMGPIGWLIAGPFILAFNLLYWTGQLLAAGGRAVRDARPEPAARQLARRARRHQITGYVILAACGVLAVVVIVALA